MDTGPAPISLVVNADDFGLTPDVSRGILKAHATGIVTSTSVIGICADPAAIALALSAAPTLGVGAQLCLVAGTPILGAAAVPSLVTAGGTFPDHAREIYLRWARGDLRGDDVEREFDAQVTRLRDAGLHLDHLNADRHLGFIPTVGRSVEAVARRHKIPGLRMAVERPNLGWLTEARRGAAAAALGTLAWLTRQQLGTLRHGPQTWGYIESGRLDQIRILEILGRLGPGAHELICHPGDADDHCARTGELRDLASPLVKEAVTRRGIRLCRWQDLF